LIISFLLQKNHFQIIFIFVLYPFLGHRINNLFFFWLIKYQIFYHNVRFWRIHFNSFFILINCIMCLITQENPYLLILIFSFLYLTLLFQTHIEILLQHFIHQISTTCNLVLKTHFYFKLVKQCFKSLLSRLHHIFKWHMGAKTQSWTTHASLNHYFFSRYFDIFFLKKFSLF
jgi:hypothetical protein